MACCPHQRTPSEEEPGRWRVESATCGGSMPGAHARRPARRTRPGRRAVSVNATEPRRGRQPGLGGGAAHARPRQRHRAGPTTRAARGTDAAGRPELVHQAMTRIPPRWHPYVIRWSTGGAGSFRAAPPTCPAPSGAAGSAIRGCAISGATRYRLGGRANAGAAKASVSDSRQEIRLMGETGLGNWLCKRAA
jgi:hypothetical protein